VASENSFRQAIYLACDVFANRKMYKEVNANKLVTTVQKIERE